MITNMCAFIVKLPIDEKSSIHIENKGELLLGKKAINRYHLYVFLTVFA
jgi:hypothetical protein